ncbi:MAG: hypothetical protein D6805_08610 [Planctomycetota bacterium]|nr:MAG: hypothetical protein D6805_08610 [Planctomycetota bacterium]
MTKLNLSAKTTKKKHNLLPSTSPNTPSNQTLPWITLLQGLLLGLALGWILYPFLEQILPSTPSQNPHHIKTAPPFSLASHSKKHPLPSTKTTPPHTQYNPTYTPPPPQLSLNSTQKQLLQQTLRLFQLAIQKKSPQILMKKIPYYLHHPQGNDYYRFQIILLLQKLAQFSQNWKLSPPPKTSTNH